MKILISAVASVVLIGGLLAHRPSDEEEVRQAVQSFHAAFNQHDFRSAEEYTTEDWNHINPFGGWTRGRDAVLKELREVHSTFLKGVSATVEDFSVRFASRDVAVVTVTSRSSTFTKEDWGLIPFSLLWGGFAIFWLLGASGIGDFWTNRPDKTFQWFGVIWGTLFVLIGQYMIWGRFVYSYWKKQRTYYALTTRRALIVVNGFRGRTASSAYFENMTIIDKSVRHDGIGSISFGGPVTGEWRCGRNNPPRPPTFDDIESVDSVYQIAARLREQAQKPGAPASSRWSS